MDVKNISLEENYSICQREESHFFDAKAAAVSGVKVEKIAVAFANADGGEFYIGIRDPKDEPDYKKRWQGSKTIEDLNALLQCLFNLSPSLELSYTFLKCENLEGYVLRILIEKGTSVHKTSDGTIYQRHGAQSIPLKDPEKITALSFAKGSTSYEDQTIKEVELDQIVESPKLKEFLNGYSPKTDPLEFCVNQNLFTFKEWHPRVASILLFHQTPYTVIPKKCSVKITRYETREDDPERDHLAAQHNIEGSLNDTINATVNKITEIISAVRVMTADGLKNMNFPKEAIWEIIVNAVIHRDYAISDDIHVLIFDNRLEISSPGRLPGYVKVENILEARYARNPKIVRTLNRYPNPPNKDMGEGLNTTFQKMREWGLKDPEIAEDGNYVKVILPHIPLASPSEAILKFLRNNDNISNSQGRLITGIKSENQMKNEFYKLRDQNLLELVPGRSGFKAAWQPTKKGKDEIGKIT